MLRESIFQVRDRNRFFFLSWNWDTSIFIGVAWDRTANPLLCRLLFPAGLQHLHAKRGEFRLFLYPGQNVRFPWLVNKAFSGEQLTGFFMPKPQLAALLLLSCSARFSCRHCDLYQSERCTAKKDICRTQRQQETHKSNSSKWAEWGHGGVP